ncbi:signal peptide protein [Caballeronia calidae]|uniref:Signal peptide protein n=1 Tax=Caballeronia calidae TaxID=1777139 RepID=A0A158CXC1_9BURK|nr:hypothetical protein [Caballeronia calidae]SAK86596.1 signal peptide protein [Caballeronia calidae]
MKTKILLGLVAGIVISQAGCTTKILSVPIPAEVKTQDKQGVAMYFGDQTHASVRKKLETKEVRVRVPGMMEGKEATCNAALGKAVNDLREYARTRQANAVINVKTRFQRTESSSATDFTCGASNNGSTLAVSGDIVQLDTE